MVPLFAITPLTVDAAAITNFETAATDGGTGLTETITNLIGVIGIIAIASLLMWYVYRAFFAPMRLVKRI